jgi:hypothetical protein
MGTVGTLGFVAAMLMLGSSGSLSQYGKLDLPGAKVVHLPKGRVQVTFDAQQGDLAYLPIPVLAVTAKPAGGGDGADPVYTKNIGTNTTTNGDDHTRIGYLAVPSAGDYRVNADGGVGNYLAPQLWFGKSKSHDAVRLLIVTGIAVVAIFPLSLLLLLILRRRQ